MTVGLEVVDLERQSRVLSRGAATLVEEDQGTLAGVDEDALGHVRPRLRLEAQLLFVERTRPVEVLGGEGGRGGRGGKSCGLYVPWEGLSPLKNGYQTSPVRAGKTGPSLSRSSSLRRRLGVAYCGARSLAATAAKALRVSAETSMSRGEGSEDSFASTTSAATST